MRYVGCHFELSKRHLSDLTPFILGRLRFEDKRSSEIVLGSCRRIRTYAADGRIRRVDERNYLSNLRLDFFYGWLYSPEGLHLAFYPPHSGIDYGSG